MLRWAESFDGFTTTTPYATKYNTSVIGGIVAGRFGNCISMNANNTTRQIVRVLDAQSTWLIGCACQFSNIGSVGYGFDFINIQDGGSGIQMGLRLDTVGRITANRNGALVGTGTRVLVQDVWYYIECKFVISDTVGTVDVRIDEVSEISLTNQDTRAFGTTADRFQLRSQTGTGSPAPTILFDDLIVMDGQTGAGSNPMNAFVGDSRVENRLPNGDGNYSQFTGSDGNSTNNSLLVDEADPNGDTDYVQDATVGDRDSYAFQDISSASATVFGVQTNLYARKDDAGGRSIASMARLSATDQDGPSQVLSTTYATYSDIRETKPGGGDWTVTDFGNTEFGHKVAA